MTKPFHGPLTGPRVFMIFLASFGVIISVNVFMAWQAIATFPGVEVANSYVASQTFDRERTAQEALGWRAEAVVENGSLRVTINDAAGRSAEAVSLSAVFGRPTQARDDQELALTFDGTAWRAPVTAAAGAWHLRLEAVATDGTLFRQRLSVRLP